MLNSEKYILFILAAVFAVHQMDRHIMSILLDQIGDEFALTDTQLGLLSGPVFIAVYVVFGFPIAKFAARASKRKIIAGSVVIWSALTITMAGAQNFLQLALARLGVGIGEAGGVVPAHSMISDIYPQERRTSAMSTFTAGANIGVLLAFFVGGVAGQYLGWRWAFVIAGVPGLVLAFLMWMTVKEPVRALPAGDDDYSGSLFAATFKIIWSDQGLRHAMFGLAITGVVTFGALSWNAVFILRMHELSQAQTGIFLALTIGILGGLGTWSSGVLADKLGVRNSKWRLGVVICAILLTKPLAALFLLVEDTRFALTCMAMAAIFSAVYWGPTFAFLHGRVPVNMRPMATAIFMFAFNVIGVGLGPLLVGLASDILFADLGARSVGYGLLMVQFAGVWGAWHYWQACKTIALDPSPS